MIKICLVLALFCQNTVAQTDIRLMTMNIWQEGTSVVDGLEKIKNVILEAQPDIVCFTEVRNYQQQDWTSRLVDELDSEGQAYFGDFAGGDVSIISKFPIEASKLVTEGEGSVVLFDVKIGGLRVVVGCAHLDYTYYACYLPRGYWGGDPNWNMIDDGSGRPKPVTDVSEIEAYNLKSERDEQIRSFLLAVENEKAPVILMGDFNEPSHLDWTADASRLFEHNGVAINWHSTYMLYKKGFADAYREVYPNELTHPGITWPSPAFGKNSTSWTPHSDERDRIDYIFYKGDKIRVKEAFLVGPKPSYAYGKLSESHVADDPYIADELPWPSDHKAVMAVMTIEAP